MRRFLCTIILVILCFIFQSTVFQAASLAGIVPNLFVILVVAIGYIYGNIPGLCVGFFSGLLVDMMYGNLIGFYAMGYLTIGYMNGYAKKIYYRDENIIPLFLIAVSDFSAGFYIYVMQFLLRSRLDFLFYFRTKILPELLYTVLIAVFVYRLLHRLYLFLDTLDYKED